jgi:bidirectional [NiFe] hydrogenase diaphorase subunit
MISLTIDGIPLELEQDITLLAAAQKIGIRIPTLCHHESLSPYGGCRLCIVEVTRNSSTQIVSACSYAAADGLVVETATETIRALRKGIVSLLLAEAPQARALQELARELGVVPGEYGNGRKDLCIVCGRCVRACREIVGASAIDFAGRGYTRIAASPFFKRAEDCIGCGTCVAICPTGAVAMHTVVEGATEKMPDGEKLQGPARILDNWKAGFPLKRCSTCGEAFAPEALLKFFVRRASLPDNFYDVCPDCRPL